MENRKSDRKARWAFALAAELALECGRRISEIAVLKGRDVDKEHGLLHIVGKSGKHRDVPPPRMFSAWRGSYCVCCTNPLAMLVSHGNPRKSMVLSGYENKV